MILTVTPNPSLDKTVELSAPLAVGQVQRAAGQHAEPGGKGVNIARALAAAGEDSLALLPGDPGDPVLTALEELAVRHEALPIGTPLRTNITITDPAGTTTKVNELGPALPQERVEAFLETVIRRAGSASWAALAGSLPPGMPETFYADVIAGLRNAGGPQPPPIAVDASGPALAHAAASGPDLIKPNAEELLELHAALCGAAASPAVSPAELEGERGLAAELVRSVQKHGVRAALVTLGAHGAVLVPEPSSDAPVLAASGPPLVVRSTVGAGDASLAGYVLAAHRGAAAEERLRRAAAQGRAAASLPGSTMPRPQDLRILDIVVEELPPTK
ncbi:1-phosphofructokinase family hexose kinase [Nesterenkonia populi]|uniref:1-phosphofructokinase family hexose kinase n=1 Tax=Nesterenkonia populi TaxID=1591087 RepID=UPI0011BF7D86|nr:1-phosphofructokinase family hexose kinase [Nesterenkonia populi]